MDTCAAHSSGFGHVARRDEESRIQSGNILRKNSKYSKKKYYGCTNRRI